MKVGLAIGIEIDISFKGVFVILIVFDVVLWDVLDNDSVLFVIRDEWADVDKFDEYVNDARSLGAVLYEFLCLEKQYN